MLYWALKIVLTPLLWVVFRVRVVGRSNVPRSGAVIMASNHSSFIDSIFMSLVVRRRLTFVAKAEYFETWKTAWFFRALGMIPLKREGGTASQRALIAASEVLTSGGMLGIYPEGTRSPDGRLYKGHTGVARLAIQCDAAVVPVAQFGTAAVQPIGSRFPKLFTKVTVKIGEPMRFTASGDGSEGGVGVVAADGTALAAGELRRFTDEIMAAIQKLSGQEQVHQYAKRDVGRLAAPGSEADPIPPDGPGDHAVAATS